MNFTPQQQYSLLSKMGYTGPVDSSQMENFMRSNPGAAAKMGKFDRAMKRGFQEGGLTSGSVSSSTKIEAARKEYSQAMARLARAEQIKNGWSISGIETKQTQGSQPSSTPTQPSSTPTQPSSTPTRTASQQAAYDRLSAADKAIVNSQFGGVVPGYMYPGGDR